MSLPSMIISLKTIDTGLSNWAKPIDVLGLDPLGKGIVPTSDEALHTIKEISLAGQPLDELSLMTILGSKPREILVNVIRMIAGITGNYAFTAAPDSSGVADGDVGLQTDFQKFIPTNGAYLEAFINNMAHYFDSEAAVQLYGRMDYPDPGASTETQSTTLWTKYNPSEGQTLELIKMAILCHVGSNTDNQELMYNFCRYIEELNKVFRDPDIHAIGEFGGALDSDASGDTLQQISALAIETSMAQLSLHVDLTLAMEKLAASLLDPDGSIYTGYTTSGNMFDDDTTEGLENFVEYTINDYEIDDTMDFEEHIAYNGVLLTPIGLALQDVSRSDGDLFYAFSQISRVATQIIAQKYSGEIMSPGGAAANAIWHRRPNRYWHGRALATLLSAWVFHR